MVWRPFYFARLVVDPKNPDRLFKPGLHASSSARTAARASPPAAAAPTATGTISGSIPTNPTHVIGGDDGGLWLSHDGGSRWCEGEEPAHLPVLPRERRREGSVPGLRRPPGQQLLGRRLVLSRRHHQRPLGEPLRRRRLLGRRRPHRSRGRLLPSARAATSRASTAAPTRRATSSPRPRYKEKLRFNWNTPIHAEPHAEGHPLHRRAVPLPLQGSRRHLGAHLPGSDHQRPREAEAGAVRRRHRRQLLGRDAHHHLLHQRVAQGPQGDLGRHRRRQPPAHARRGQDLDQRGRPTCPACPRPRG